MGGCHSYPTATKADGKAPPDINNDKLGINNNNLEERPYLQQEYVCQHITHLDMSALTALPPGVDKAEWLASNTVTFFKHINLFSSALSEFCTPSTCPTACGPGDTVYVWTDDHGRKLKCSAPLYFDYAMSYIQDLLTDEDVFPTKAARTPGCAGHGAAAGPHHSSGTARMYLNRNHLLVTAGCEVML
ncbi:MOB kinase activator 2 isoform X2 [Dunckerocampus dactyliophorus]|uniref:MOB kinase activator 2 isoform X2 n=1 Tax=Dunckerocampus dactyliophorus TaxID=161453 RepID=UPI0024052E3F|nr:MOB kinase activator 2 isoform X2 [Dunckerocampus dactyliophorus]